MKSIYSVGNTSKKSTEEAFTFYPLVTVIADLLLSNATITDDDTIPMIYYVPYE